MPTAAENALRLHNPNGLIGEDDDAIVMIEDVTDPDGRMYRLEYRSMPDAHRAVAYCLYNPWGDKPNAGEEYPVGHVAENGFLCLGSRHTTQRLEDSPYDIEYVVPRARFWCTGFSVLKETGEFPNT